MTTLPRLARLHLLTLASFAVAQPLYDLIGRHSEFLVAHGAGTGTIVAMILVLSLGVGLLFVAAVEVMRRWGPRAGLAAQLAAVAILGALIAAGPARGWPAIVAIPVSIVAGIALAAAYLAGPVRTFLTILTPSIAIFPLIFVLATPVARLVREAPTGGSRADLRGRPPIVVVIFDEFSTFDIIDAGGAIDRRQFPTLAALADTSTWFPNAVSPYPYTERAIPAMLTGVAADGADTRLPIAADHPNNLFGWLSDSYRLHVSEPLSALCAAEACTSEAAVAKATTADLVIDTGILYLHLIAPRDIADRRLPSLTGTWKRFTTAGGAPVVAPNERPKTFDLVARFERASQPGRDLLFRQFIDGIDRDLQPTFHFIHVLLPHDPYVFTSTGRRYSVGGTTEGMNAEGVWTTHQPLVETGRQRHAAQARLSDKLLGELVAKLRAQEIFDQALLIVTADHGGAFKPGEPHRFMNTRNATEIIPVPMLVKLPGQRTAAVNERAVSGLDLAPTIAAALNTSLPWQHDGRAMLADQYPARRTLTYSHAGVEPLPVFDVRAAARTGEFGLAALARLSTAAGALPPLPADIDQLPAAAGMRVFSENFAKLETVSADGLLPALVTGEVQLDEPRGEPLTLAFAVNGAIAAVTRTSRWAESDHYFNVLLPDELIRVGANRLDILLVRQPAGGAAALERIADDFTRGLTLVERSTGQAIARRDGTEIRVGGRVTGSIDRAAEEPDTIKLFGWAADTASPNPLRAVVAFSGGRAIAFTSPHAERPDVTAALGLRSGQKVSFALNIPRHAIAGPITVLGLSSGGEAGGLQTSPPIAVLLQTPSKGR